MGIKADDIAVIGMAGRFPGADSVAEFWANLCAGKQSLRELSDDELRLAGVAEEQIADPSYVKWAAPLADFDKFDPAFFKVSPRDAELMDPQLRLLLQCAWEALEDAGHASNEARNIGVFAGGGGVTTGYLSHFINRNGDFDHFTVSPTHLGNDKDFLSTYISYKLNLTGPSVTVQTACSTSLVALHQARLSLLAGECDMALAGGVTIRVPNGQGYHYKEGHIFSRSGRISAFDADADGVVFGSGLGLVVIKRLADAQRDGDSIYAVLKGSAIVNDGKGKMSYAASSARGQIACARAALKAAGVSADAIGFVESHGTGTAMGDPEEIKALSAAFRQDTDSKAYCALGAVKSNIGHLEAAAGITGFIKAVLAVKTGLIPPVVNYRKPNPRIRFDNTPFFVNSEAQTWGERRKPRVGAVNSLGVGGTNAFMVVEAYRPRSSVRKTPTPPFVAPLSARDDASLRAYAARLAALLGTWDAGKTPADLQDLAYTLQIGRAAMARRVAFVVASSEELKTVLEQYAEGQAPALPDDDLGRLAAQWCAGEDVEWSSLHVGTKPRRISLPTYVFARERYWAESATEPAAPAMRPLMLENTSDLREQRYSTTLTGDEFFLKDHRVALRLDAEASVQQVLPGVAYLEMARAALERATPDAYTAGIELRDLVWLQPLSVDQATSLHLALAEHEAGEDGHAVVDFEIYTGDDVIHGQGSCRMTGEAQAVPPLDIPALTAEMRDGIWTADAIYDAFSLMGLHYGPAHRSLARIHRGEGGLLAQLALPQGIAATLGDYVLHPALMDGAFQAATTLLFDLDALPPGPIVPFALGSLRVLAPCVAQMQAWARFSPGAQAEGAGSLDIDLCDADGKVCVQMRGFVPRSTGPARPQALLATQVWRDSPIAPQGGIPGEPHVLVAGLPGVGAHEVAPGGITLEQAAAAQIGAEQYRLLAMACFERAGALIRQRPKTLQMIQLVLPNSDAFLAHAGLAGMLKSVNLEHPQVAGQVIFVDPDISQESLADLLLRERSQARDTVIRYRRAERAVLGWHLLDPAAEAPVAPAGLFKEHGVYLLTGGLGGLGVLFAREILARVPSARLILTGRSSAEQVAASPQRQAALAGLQAAGSVEYCQLDLASARQVEQQIAGLQAKYQRINGIIHAAGAVADGLVLTKTQEAFNQVLAPKVQGTHHLDLASQGLELDFFVLFSSLSSAVGNLGQADYAAANGFLDTFAAQRNRMVAQGARHGLTQVIRWPLWQQGGMQVDAAGRENLYEATGIRPMATAAGMQMFYRSLASGLDQTLVMSGDMAVMRRALRLSGSAADTAAAVAQPTSATPDRIDDAERLLCAQLASVLKLPKNKIDAAAALEDYGIDSILALDLTRQLEKSFGTLPKTLFFEYLTIRELAAYFAREHGQTVASLGGQAEADGPAASATAAAPVAEAAPLTRGSLRRGRRAMAATASTPIRARANTAQPIAIVGLSGRYPESRDLQAFWRNLRDGKDCIVEVPATRWDWQAYYDADRTTTGNHYSKWGGFIEGVDEFDARFFNVSPVEAELLDPQERLFLQHAWMAIEDGGYTRAALQTANCNETPGAVGVYAGVMYSEYQLFGAEASLQGRRMGFASNPASVANRVSYFLNLHGPSMVVDTMCSSSLTAIHMACQDLQAGRTALGIAGGVNVTIHPNKYLMLSAGQFLSGAGQCQSFGEGGDGYIPGEGVGVVLLKRLADAERDGNLIYGVIRGSALSHGGKTNGYTVPNPQAQATAIRLALAEADVDARHISYLEAHGTGTKLGDPIEIAALTKVFRESTADSGFCLIGSAKSNIGHAEAAAGIAGLTKVLLQMKHGQIVPSLHSGRLNPHIDFARTPFIVNQALRTWQRPVVDGRELPRIAGVSSFGAGGANAHLVVEEYAAPAEAQAAAGPQIFPLSARGEATLRQKAEDLIAFLSEAGHGGQLPSLAAMAHTLQVGREAMDMRLVVIADSVPALVDGLRAFLDGKPADGLVQGRAVRQKDALSLLADSPELPAMLDRWIAGGQYAQLAELWVKGIELDWQRLHPRPPRMVSLPTYPFLRQRHWIDVASRPVAMPRPAPVATAPASVAMGAQAEALLPQAVLAQETPVSLRVTEAQAAALGDSPVAAAAKPRGIALNPPRASLAPAAIGGAKPRLRLALPVSAPAARDEGGVSLFRRGGGVYALRIRDDARSNVMSPDILADLVRALQVVQAEPDAKVLLLEGGSEVFLQGDGEAHRHAWRAQLYTALAGFPYPVVAAARGDALGAGLLVAALCDFLVCGATARYGFALRDAGLYPSMAAGVLSARFGRMPADDLLYLTESATGAELRSQGWRCAVTAVEDVQAQAEKLAISLAQKSQSALRLLKQELARGMLDAARAMPDAAALPRDAEALATLPEAPAGLAVEDAGARVLKVTIRATPPADAGRVLGDLQALFDRIAAVPGWHCVMLCSELPGFLPACPAAQRTDAALQWAGLVQSFDRPLIAVTEACDDLAAFVALHCDVWMQSGAQRMGLAALAETALAPHVAAMLARHLGADVASRVLMSADAALLHAVPGNAGTWRCVDRTALDAESLRVAQALARLPLAELQAWKRQAVRAAEAPLAALQGQPLAIDPPAPEAATPAAVPVPLGSGVISAYAHADGVLEVRMADRDARNMFTPAFSEGMRAAFAEAARGDYKVVLLTGYDNYFAMGGTPDTLRAIHEGSARFTDNTVFQLPLSCPIPVVAAMQGHGLGAGWALGMFADYTVFSDESRYGSPYMDYGFTPGAGATLIFPERVGLDLARLTLLTAVAQAGGELLAQGLPYPVLPRHEVAPAALALARQIARSPRARLEALKNFSAAGLRAALPQTFERELAMHDQTFVGQADTIARIERSLGEPAKAQAPALPMAQATGAPVGEVDAILADLRQMLAHELRMPAADIDADDPFVDLGLDSITGVTWIRGINEKYGTDIEAIKVYSHPTLTQLAAFVREQAGEHISPAAPGAAQAITPPSGIMDNLRGLLAQELRLPADEIGEDEPFVDLGLDSITGVTWVRRINDLYGTDIEAVQIYSYPTLRQLGAYVASLAGAHTATVAAPAASEAAQSIAAPALPSQRASAAAAPARASVGPIAVIGMAGQFAKARNLDEFWRNIEQGRDCIEEVPRHRWDIDEYYQDGETTPGKTYSRWMGALDDYDQFDAAFFNISPREARSMDPQQRLFLQACWHGIEHAGYNPRTLAGSRCGVFVGCSTGDYHQLSRREQLSGQGFTGAAPSILAARISYLLDLHGPSLAIDTACSSSLVAIATACDSLALGASDMALAGGVNVMAGPAMQIMTAQVGMLSPAGRCRSFDASASGIVNGEGVGVVVLKRLADAERDGDCIYGVVEGWGVNQDGKTNGMTAPNADSQTRLQQDVYDRFGIDPASIGLIEAHGTGTPLGDPIEVAGLKASFAKYTRNTAYCALGSVKSNIGHCLTAAGVSGLLKAVLAVHHGKLPPSLHVERLNPHIKLEGTPFYISDQLRDWPRTGAAPRRAAINAFGFSGTNAHVVVSEYRARAADQAHTGAVLVPLSGATEAQLVRAAGELLAAISQPGMAPADLGRIAHTLQTGREALPERLAMVVSDLNGLKRALEAVVTAGAPVSAAGGAIFRGQANPDDGVMRTLAATSDFQSMVATWLARRELERLGEMWVKGLALDWSALYAGDPPRRIGLPGHPFATRRFWIEPEMEQAEAVTVTNAPIASPDPAMAEYRPQPPAAPVARPVVVLANTQELPMLAATSATTSVATAPSLPQLQQELRASLAEALFMQPADIAVTRSFTELGLDSIIGVEWVKALNKQYGTDIAAARIYDYPNLAELSMHLQSRLAVPAQPPVAPPPVVALADPATRMAPSAAASSTLPAISLAQLQQELRASLAEALFMQPADIQAGRSFTELGLDSIIGVEWVKALNKQYGTEVAAARIYDYPNIGELAVHLHEQIASATPRAPAPVPEAAITWDFRQDRSAAPRYFAEVDIQGDFARDGEVSLHYLINPANNVSLQEHVLSGEHVLPTDAYMELVYSAYRQCFAPARVRLAQISIANPLVGQAGLDTRIRLTFRNSGSRLQFFVRSSPALQADADMLNMQGVIEPAGSEAVTPSLDATVFERTLQATDIATNVGHYYAPLQSLSLGESSAMGLIRPAQHDYGFTANPFVIYGALSTAITYARHLAAERYDAGDHHFLPYRIGRLAMLAALDDVSYRSHAQLRSCEPEAIAFDIDVVDEAGQLVLRIEEIVLRRVAQAKLLPARQPTVPAQSRPEVAPRTGGAVEKVAIIGMSCRYPMSENVDALWENLKAGRDCVVEVPAERWGAADAWYHPEPSHEHTAYSKWSGLMDGIEYFDALFFGMAPAEAELVDPQQRIFLEECWKAIESAGHAPSSLANQACGVYVGCAGGDYVRLLNEAGRDTAGAAFMGTSSAILAARIAYHLNLKGPAIAVDTACSSSLVALHLACESIRSGENTLALAGGVNVLTTAIGHVLTSQVGMLSRDGRCAPFDASAGGIVFSEGCGVVMLKALSAAERDHDNILGVIEGSGTNQDGRTNGITAPSGRAQQALLRQVYERFDIDPARISYVEAHGTGTPLGDPIEADALKSVFGRAGGEQTCALGSVKSNIGHSGFAAGVGGVIKTLLCLQHRKLVPVAHFTEVNPQIELDDSPFYVNAEYRDWPGMQPRMAGVSSFGFSGTNAHVVISEHPGADQPAQEAAGENMLVPLSAKTPEQLRQQALDLAGFLRRRQEPIDLRRLTYTLQVGRDGMEHRLALIVDSLDALVSKLHDWLDGRGGAGIFQGRAEQEDDALASLAADADMRSLIEQWVTRKNLGRVAELWVRGVELALGGLHDGRKPRRMVLPTYPFARERCWVTPRTDMRAALPAAAQLHPMLHRNTSDLAGQRYASEFVGNEFFVADHRVQNLPVLPAVAYLEMVRAALDDALPKTEQGAHVALQHVVWLQPMVMDAPRHVNLAVFDEDDGELSFEIHSRGPDGSDVLHCQGRGVIERTSLASTLNLADLRGQMQQGTVAGDTLYPRFAGMGLQYGPAFRAVDRVHMGVAQALVELRLPDAAQAGAACMLPPSLMDGALQGSIPLIADAASSQAVLPFALESLRVFSPCPERLYAWVRHADEGGATGVVKVDIDLCAADGRVCVQMRGFSSRPLEATDEFDESHYASLLQGIASDDISIDDAVKLG